VIVQTLRVCVIVLLYVSSCRLEDQKAKAEAHETRKKPSNRPKQSEDPVDTIFRHAPGEKPEVADPELIKVRN